MKTQLSGLFVVGLLLPLLVSAQTSNQIVIGQIDSMHSKILHEKRKIWVHVPKSYFRESTQRYPVIYLLDGDAHFSSVVGMIEQLSTVNGNMICPEMIVVGIPNTNRMRDLSPTSGGPPVPSPLDSVWRKTSGGGENFTAFMEKELMPRVDSLYPTLPYRVLIGHSLGGLLVINTLLHHPQLFNAYVAIDPSMWWDKRRLLNEAKTTLPTRNYAGKALFVGIANTMQSAPMDTLQVQKDTVAIRGHIRSILELHHLVKANPQTGLRYKGSYYADDSHGSVPLISEYDALHFLFENYNFDVQGPDFMDDDDRLTQRLSAHFARISKTWGVRVDPPQELVSSVGQFMLSAKAYKKAESLFRLNAANYPKNASVYNDLGDYYVARKDTANAIAQYQKALAMKDTADVRKKLTALQAKSAPDPSPADRPQK